MRPGSFMLIAGEASGDALAAELVHALRQEYAEAPAVPTTDYQPRLTTLAPRFFGAGGPLLAGLLYDRSGSYTLAFVLFSAFWLIGFVAAYVLSFIAFCGAWLLTTFLILSFGLTSHFAGEFLIASPIFAYLDAFRPSLIGNARSETWPFNGFSFATWFRGFVFYSCLVIIIYALTVGLAVRRYSKRG